MQIHLYNAFFISNLFEIIKADFLKKYKKIKLVIILR